MSALPVLLVAAILGCGTTGLDESPGAELPAQILARPAWSPDGDRIGFVNTGAPFSIVQWTEGESEVQVLTSGVAFDWAPSGAEIVVPGPGLRIHSLVDESSRSIGAGLSASVVRWSPTGQHVLARGARGDEAESLWLVPADGSAATDLGVLGGTVSWSPDGESVVYSARTDEAELRVFDLVDPAGTDRLLLEVSPAHARHPAWSPDGDRIAFHQYGGGMPTGLWVVRSDGTERRLLVEHGSGPAWSPDGTRLVYEHLNEAENRYELWIVDVATGDHRPMLPVSLAEDLYGGRVEGGEA